MKNNTNQLLIWLKEFKNIWLLENIPNDIHVVNLIKTKIVELEQLIIENNDNEEEYHRTKLLNDDSLNNSDNEQIPIASTSTHETFFECSLPISSNIHFQSDNETEEEQSKRILLEQSDNSQNQNDQLSSSDDDDDVFLLRPSICLKRISQADAERYMPIAWKNIKSKRLSTASDSSNSNDIPRDSNIFETLTPSKTNHNNSDTSSNDEKKAKEKLLTSDNDQASASSKIHKNNEISTTTSSSDDDDDDFNIKTRTRKSLLNKTERSPIKLRKHANRSHKKHDIIINYNLSSTIENESSLDEPILKDSLAITQEITPMDEDQILKDVIENNDNESIFTSLDITPDKQMETNLNDDIEDPLNNEIDSSSTQDSTHDGPPIEVPSYAHLLTRSKSSSSSSSSDSNNENVNNNDKKKSSVKDKKQLINGKRSTRSSSNSDTSTVKKKSKLTIKQRVVLSSFSSSSNDDDDDNDNDNKLKSTVPEDASTVSPKHSSSRIRIQRSSSSSSSSSSEDSNNDNDISTKHSRKQRKRRSVSNERSSILKEIKRKTRDKKNSTSTRTTGSNENSLDNNSDNQTKTKKTKLQRSGDENNSTTDEDEEEEDDDDEEEEEGVSPTKRKHGRKNIRKIIDDKELDIQTKDAIEAERERRKRIAEKQKEYNETLLEQSSYMSNNGSDELNTSNHRLILELDKNTNEPLIEVSSKLVEQLKPHQCDGVRFLWNNVFESIDAIKNKKRNGNGCILAHCMGLGKTLQVISFIHTVFNYDNITKVKTCLILCPINAALNWSNEFDHWLTDVEPPIDCYQLTTVKPNLRVSHLNYWYENGGVVIMGYEMYRRLANGFGLKNKKLKADAYKCLVDPGPDIAVADEGHILKNAQTALAKCLSKIKTSRRIVLTGTPLQNNLIEYYCMVSFIKPNLLGSQSEYINRFVNPIQNGQHRDSNEEDVRLMKRRACVLHELLTGFIDRRDYSLLKEYLPPKFEYIINIRLSDLQSKLYDIYLKQQVDQTQRSSISKKDFKSAKLFADYQYLQKIWTHPFLLYPHFIDRWKKRLNKDDDSIIDDNELEAMFIDDEENVEESKKKNKKLNEKEKESTLENNYSGFLIDNIQNEIDENKPIISKTTKRKTSISSTTTTLDSDSPEDNIKIDAIIDSDSKSTNSDHDIEIIKTYPTRSRTTINNELKKSSSSIIIDSNIFDTENNQNSTQEINNNNNEEQEENSYKPWLNEMRSQFWFPFLDMLPEESKFDIELSGKFLLLKFIIDKCAEIGDKILLFSRSLYALNYIESFLKYLHIENEKEYQKQCESRRQLREILSSNNDNITNEHIPEPVQWIRDQDYFRMDGQTEIISRKRYAKTFNDLSNLRARLFLISTLAGGIGINLTGSNRVIVFDASWNPSHDTQAIFRSYRFGQKKPVYVYRLLAHGTMEEKIYQRQVVKQSISQRVVDDHQLDRHFTQSDIKELYKFKPEQLPEARSTSTLLTESDTNFNYPIPKDHLLLDLLYEHSRWIHSYHSHDSLLENKLDECLSAEERRRALEEYESLKRLPDQRQIALQRFQQQQQLNALIAQQQQLASTQGRRLLQQNQNFQQLYSDIYQPLQNVNEYNLDIARVLQSIYDMQNGRDMTNNITKPTNRRIQQQSMMNQNTTGN
ncbi:unnamed protein product [Rotaria sordida]|uniref:Transcriptional regulator ATRX homolog n=1 Tax=Rotaria sordida TaxID=392033 RepID=A0A818RTH9_9BILA|nr:unnamed protein product [Rotaria sordida]